jgi:hypothetical protein
MATKYKRVANTLEPPEKIERAGLVYWKYNERDPRFLAVVLTFFLLLLSAFSPGIFFLLVFLISL